VKKHHQDSKETISPLVHRCIRLLVYHSLNRVRSRWVCHIFRTVYIHKIGTFFSPF